MPIQYQILRTSAEDGKMAKNAIQAPHPVWWEIEGEWSIGMEVKVLMTAKFKFPSPFARCFLISEENEDNFDCNSSSAWNCIHNLPYATWSPFFLHLSFTYPTLDNLLHYFDLWHNTHSNCWVLVLVKTYLLAFKQIASGNDLAGAAQLRRGEKNSINHWIISH